MKGKEKRTKDLIGYYENRDILKEITDEEVALTLEDQLREDILSGKRKRKLKNITIKMDPLQIMAVKKLAAMKSVPYQTLIRHWLAEDIKGELHLITKKAEQQGGRN